MSRFHSYLNTATQIIQQYKGEEPFPYFLKFFFATHKKYGSKDRKQISHLCYCYFRLGKAAQQNHKELEETVLTGLFLCSHEPNKILQAIKPEWSEWVSSSIYKKLVIINRPLVIEKIFPWKEELSNEINYDKFCKSFLTQPDLFLRLRPGKEKEAIEKLQKAEIKYNRINPSCLVLPNAVKVESILELDKEAVVQDFSSQSIGKFFQFAIGNRQLAIETQNGINVWDCCAGSGGKSILAYDLIRDIDLTVSDIRKNILINLKKRFVKAGIKKYKSFIADLTTSNLQLPTTNLQLPTSKFDLIMCDAPCTGSGTWSRTPEQLYFFNENKIDHYTTIQKKILDHVIPFLEKEGVFIYITCSVFKKENEEIVEFVKQNHPLELEEMEILKGYDKKADTMFVAVFRNK